MSFDVEEYTKTVELLVPDDSDYQVSAGNISLTLVSASSSELGTRTRVEITVIDNDDAGRIGFQDLSAEAIAQTARINVKRDRGSAGTVTARLVSTVSGFIEGAKFSATVTFEPGETLTSIDIPIRPSEEYVMGSFELSLVNASGGAILGSNAMTVNVRHEDGVSFPGSAKLATSAVTGGTIDFQWADPLFLGGPTASIVQYELELKAVYGSIHSYIVSGTNMLHVSRLRSDSVYNARIAAVNQRGRGSFSNYVSVSTTSPNYPGPVRELKSIAVTGGLAQLGWQEPLEFGGLDIASYRITFQAPQDANLRTVKVDGSTLTALIGDLKPQTIYEFAVVAVNTADMAGSETSIPLETLDETAPEAPPKPVLTLATGGALHFNVLAPFDTGGSELVEYTVYVARLTGWEVKYYELVTRSIEGISVAGVIRNESMYDLLAESTYYVKVSVRNTAVSVWTCGKPGLCVCLLLYY